MQARTKRPMRPRKRFFYVGSMVPSINGGPCGEPSGCRFPFGRSCKPCTVPPPPMQAGRGYFDRKQKEYHHANHQGHFCPSIPFSYPAPFLRPVYVLPFELREGSMKGVYISHAELTQLDGVSLLAFRLYIVLRTLIDLTTGLVGRVRRISYQALAEQCETATPRGKGFQLVKPTEKSLRVALHSLERLGLVVRQEGFELCYHLPMAQLRPKQTGRSEGTLDGAATSREIKEFGHTGQGNQAEPGTHLSIRENPIAPTSSISTLSSISPVDNSPGGAAADFGKSVLRLGWRYVVPHSDTTLAQWAKDGITSEQVEKAIAGAIAARRRDASTAPLFPSYVARFLPSPEDWHLSWSGIEAKGKALGIVQREGETCPSFKARVYEACGVNEAEAPCCLALERGAA